MKMISNMLYLLTLLIGIIQSKEKKVSVAEVTIDGTVESFKWCGPENSVVLVISSTGKLYRSRDGGRTWKELASLFRGEHNGSRVSAIFVHPVNSNYIVLIGNESEHFYSTDGAITFNSLGFIGRIQSLKFNPVNSKYLLASHWTDACKTGNTDDCVHKLLISTDFCETFNIVETHIIQYSWGEANNSTDQWIYFTHFKDKNKGQSHIQGWDCDVDFSVTKDMGKSKELLMEKGNKFLVSNGYVFIAVADDIARQTVKLFVSTDAGVTFNKCKLPVEVQEKSYTIIDTSEGAIMLHVNHGTNSQGENLGHVYISDESGIEFSLSLPNNVRASSGECEFDKVLSMEGVYLANFRDAVVDHVVESEETSISRRHDPNIKKSESVVRTLITFDKGGMWSYLKPPRIDSRGDPIKCGDDEEHCYLHLHGISNFQQYAPFYSAENAVGMIMGTGNVGSHLRYEPGEVNTFLSRDGGFTWSEVHKGAYIYEFGDHGGLSVMGDDTQTTNQIVFSWNEGHSWYDFDLSEQKINIDNIVIEPTASGLEFLVYGTREKNGVIFHLDFSTLNQPKCIGADLADSVSSDYETWTPILGSANSDRCILGRKITYTRKKQSSECYNGKEFKPTRTLKPCACCPEDYECRNGFSRSIESTECKPTNPNLTSEGCSSSGFFFADAYRKIPGDKCLGGWQPPKVAVPCPPAAPLSSGGKIVLWILLFMLIILICLTYYSGKFYNIFFSSKRNLLDSTRYSKIANKKFTHDNNFDFFDYEQEDLNNFTSDIPNSPEKIYEKLQYGKAKDTDDFINSISNPRIQDNEIATANEPMEMI